MIRPKRNQAMNIKPKAWVFEVKHETNEPPVEIPLRYQKDFDI